MSRRFVNSRDRLNFFKVRPNSLCRPYCPPPSAPPRPCPVPAPPCPRPSPCCNPCRQCRACTCECRKCYDCSPCRCQDFSTVSEPSSSHSDCFCGPCRACKGCGCGCVQCKRDCDVCICESSRSSSHCSSSQPCPPPSSQCEEDESSYVSDCVFPPKPDVECSCKTCGHCDGCSCKCQGCRGGCQRCSCGRVTKDPKVAACSRIVDNGGKYKSVYILINLCTRCPVTLLQVYLDLAAAFIDCNGKLVCLDPEDIAISSAPLEPNPLYNGKTDTGLLADCQRLLPGNIKIAVTLSAIPVGWSINPIPITVTGRVNCTNVLISTCVENDECC